MKATKYKIEATRTKLGQLLQLRQLRVEHYIMEQDDSFDQSLVNQTPSEFLSRELARMISSARQCQNYEKGEKGIGRLKKWR
jgi:hypothetical protein